MICPRKQQQEGKQQTNAVGADEPREAVPRGHRQNCGWLLGRHVLDSQNFSVAHERDAITAFRQRAVMRGHDERNFFGGDEFEQ